MTIIDKKIVYSTILTIVIDDIVSSIPFILHHFITVILFGLLLGIVSGVISFVVWPRASLSLSFELFIDNNNKVRILAARILFHIFFSLTYSLCIFFFMENDIYLTIFIAMILFLLFQTLTMYDGRMYD